MTAPDPPYRIEVLADDAWLLRLGEAIDDRIIHRIHRVAARMQADRPAWLRDVVPAYASLAVFFDPVAISPGEVRCWLEAHARRPEQEMGPDTGAPGTPGRCIEIPVAYGDAFGPDLAPAAAELGLAPAELAKRHAAGHYTVAMIGFAPGFPYLSGMDPALALPRLSTPRPHIPAGSVGIGGAQTGIYPRESPGGWRLLGRTPLRLFDVVRDPPALLAPGDSVRFRRIDADEFARLSGGQP